MSTISVIHVLIPLQDETPPAVLELFKALPSPPGETYGGSPTEIHQFFLDRLKPQIDNLKADKIHFTEFLENVRFFEIANAVRPEKASSTQSPIPSVSPSNTQTMPLGRSRHSSQPSFPHTSKKNRSCSAHYGPNSHTTDTDRYGHKTASSTLATTSPETKN